MLMRLYSPSPSLQQAEIQLPISKSLMARRLLLISTDDLPDHLPENYPIDIKILVRALRDLSARSECISAGESGTAMRLLTAYIAVAGVLGNSITLYGEGRQHERPIAPLVTSLRSLGAEIDYLEQEGYPPLRITPKRLRGECIAIDASSSSQFLSALMLVAPHLLEEGRGYEIDTSKFPIASLPYAQMTEECMKHWGHRWSVEQGVYKYTGYAQPEEIQRLIEADWTAASYAYLLISLGVCNELYLPGLLLPSLQGDSVHLPLIFAKLGVRTEQVDTGVRLHKIHTDEIIVLEYNCVECPDIVPSIVASAVGRGVPFKLTGVKHLRIKESDRLEVLRIELDKLGFVIELEADSIAWRGNSVHSTSASEICLSPHGDHRMAMSLAPLFAYLLGYVQIEAPEVVAKSYPDYWEVLSSLGYRIVR